MVRRELKNAYEIQRKDEVPPDQRTTDRDRAADWIQVHIVDADRYATTTMAEMADESGWSRQHIANTLDAYFEPADPEAAPEIHETVDVELILEIYRKGYRDGWEDSSGDGVPSPDLEEVLDSVSN